MGSILPETKFKVLGQGSQHHSHGSPSNGFNSNGDAQFTKQDILEPIAIVGVSLKFPEDAISEDSYWQMMLEKRCVSKVFPKERINIDSFHNPDPNKSNTFSMRSAHFIEEDTRGFDAPFFSMTPQEAASLDPQQRGILEMTYKALENAGMPIENVRGSKTSVHVGCFTTDFLSLIWRDENQIGKYNATGGGASFLANRISWFYGLEGPSMQVDTACSSGLVALDLACTGLWSGESKMGIVACSNLIFSPELNIAFSNMGFLSPDGRCYSFDDRSNGYGRGEGFAVLVLKPLSHAVQDGDTIRALIRSTGTNQDGHTTGGLTQPSKESQSRLIDETYRKAGLEKRLTRFFEAHGTGTPIGDPIEAMAIGESFRHHRSHDDPLFVGAVKSNIGHLEGASGLAGIIKAIQILEKGLIPPNANFKRLNPRIDAEFFNLQFPQSSTPWPSHGIRRASINSFGMGGTNSHVVLDDVYHYLRTHNIAANHCTVASPPAAEAPSQTNGIKVIDGTSVPDSAVVNQDALKLFVWSAADEKSLIRLINSFTSHFTNHAENLGPDYLEDLAFTLNHRRSVLSWKSYVVADSVNQLTKLEDGASKPLLSPTSKPKLAFVFTGQGAQWFGMGRELLIYPIFRDSVLKSQDYLLELFCPWLLEAELVKTKEESRVNEPEFSQPLCTAVQIALVDLLRSFGVVPSVVVGHSSGEIASAYSIGAISARAAMKLSYYRGILASKLKVSSFPKRCMASVGLSQEQMTAELGKMQQESLGMDPYQITISCINSPKNVTISGPESQVDRIVARLASQKVFARKLQVGVGYHSPQMNDVSSEYFLLIKSIEHGNTPVPCQMVSSVTADIVSADILCTPHYWVQNMVSKVDFLGAIRRCRSYGTSGEVTKKLDQSHLKKISVDVWLEIGPHAALQGPIRDILSTVNVTAITYMSTLLRNKSAVETLLEATGRLYCQGLVANLSKVNPTRWGASRQPAVLTNLPQYSFDRSVLHWHESRLNKEYRTRKHPTNELLGTRVIDWNPHDARWSHNIRLNEIPWAKDHKVNGNILYPAAGMLSMAIEAMKQLDEDASEPAIGYELKDIVFDKPLILSTSKGVETQILLRPTKQNQTKSDDRYEFCLFVHIPEEGGFQEVCRGYIRADYYRSESEVDQGKEEKEVLDRLRILQATAKQSVDQEIGHVKMYQMLKDTGLDYGPAFQPLKEIRFNGNGDAIAKAARPKPYEYSQDHIIHPTTLDGLFQLIFVSLSKGDSAGLQTMVPTRLDRLWVSGSGAGSPGGSPLCGHAKATRHSKRTARATISALGEDDQLIKVHADGFYLTAISNSEVQSKEQTVPKYLCFNMDWKVDLDTLSPPQIQQYCEIGHEQQVQDLEFWVDLRRLVLGFGADALRQLKQSNREPHAHLARYAAWMQSQLNRDFTESTVDERTHQESIMQDPCWRERTCKRMLHSRRGELYVKVGQRIGQVLLGDLDPLQSVFQDQDLIEKFYDETNEIPEAFKLVGRYLEALVHKNPGMKILEIGGGTGATTKFLNMTLELEHAQKLGLHKYSTYDFTDISRSFLDKAKDRFRNNRMNFKLLDIEKDPVTQGFEESSYDMIIAANVFHATPNLHETIQHARKLLKPGGKLLLMEVCAPQHVLTGFVFGLLPGWWLSTEKYRQESPSITEEKWDEVLKENAFSGLDLLLKDFENVESHVCSLMVSTATEAPHTSLAMKWNVILDKTSAFQTEIAQELKRELQKAGDSIDGSLTLAEAASLPNQQNNNYIVLIELDRPLIRDLAPEELTALRTLLPSAGRLLWVSSGGGHYITTPDYGPILGLCRASRQEHFKVPLVTLALDSSAGQASERHTMNIAKVARFMAVPSEKDKLEPEYMEIDGLLHINRVTEATTVNKYIFDRTNRQERIQEFGEGPPLKLNLKTIGLIDSIEFIEDPIVSKPLGPEEIEIRLHAAGVNFKDLLNAIGQADSDILGCEGAGIVTKVGEHCTHLQPGDRVLTAGRNFFRSYARCNYKVAAKIPANMTFTQAAAIPVAFGTAWHSLNDNARVQAGESVLIHSGAGGTGQAAIQVAQLLGAEVFTTVSTSKKKQLLIDLYKIPEDHIFFSRDTSFAAGIMRMTQGKGVDVVLNSVSGEKLVATWECIAPFGRMIEIGKRDVEMHGKLAMYPFSKNTSFATVDLDLIVNERPLMASKLSQKIMELLEDNKLRPASPLDILSISDIEQALRALQGGKNSGKMVLEIKREAKVLTSLEITPSYSFNSNATYVIAGGLGGLGRSIARWLVSRGARNLILLSRSGPEGKKKAQELLIDLREQGVQVEAPSCNIAKQESLQRVLNECASKMPPVKGCFQASMVLRDTRFAEMTFQQWEESISPKIAGSWNLHTLLPKKMDFFVLLSSAVGIFGNVGQSNYAAGNTYQDTLSKFRLSQGEKAISIDLGVILGEGFVAENKSVMDYFEQLGIMLPFSLKELFALLDFYCDPSLDILPPTRSQIVTGLNIPSNIIAKGKEVPSCLYEPMFRSMHQLNTFETSSQSANEANLDYKSFFTSSPTLADAGILVSNALRKKLSKILGIPEDNIELKNRVESYGVDSLVAVELRNWLARELSADLAVFEILGGATLLAVGLTVAAKSSFRRDEWTKG